MTESRERLPSNVWRRRMGLELAFWDAGVIAVSSVLAYVLRDALGASGVVRAFNSEVPFALATAPLWLLLFWGFGAYRPEVLNAGGDATRRFTAAGAASFAALGFLSFMFNLAVSRLFILLLFAFVYLLGGMVRIGFRARIFRGVQAGRLRTGMLIVGLDEDARQVIDAVLSSSRAGYVIEGVLLEDETESTELPVLGHPRQVREVAQERGVGLVVIAPTAVAPGTLRDVFLALEGTEVDLAVAPSPFAVTSKRLSVETVGNVPLLHLQQIRLSRGRAIVKRALDLVVAAFLLLTTLPLMAVVAVLIRADSTGPALFRQQRTGKNEQTFTLLKFRTMVVDAEEQLEQLEDLNEAGHGFFKIRQDPRITRVGRVLRKWSIDELPQLWNVLRGDMSMVGPRPPLPSEVAHYEPWQLRRLRVRPGITGVWQVSGRSEVPFDEAVRMDLFYIENWSLGYDLFLLGKTVLAVLGRSGAY